MGRSQPCHRPQGWNTGYPDCGQLLRQIWPSKVPAFVSRVRERPLPGAEKYFRQDQDVTLASTVRRDRGTFQPQPRDDAPPLDCDCHLPLVCMTCRAVVKLPKKAPSYHVGPRVAAAQLLVNNNSSQTATSSGLTCVMCTSVGGNPT